MRVVMPRALRQCAVCVLLVACSRNTAVAPGALVKVPPRARTAGDELLAWAPAGASLVLEIDVARLRQNPVVGPALLRLSRRHAGSSMQDTDLGVLAQVDAILLCAYAPGSPHAATLTLVRGQGPYAWATPVAAGVHALGPPGLIERVRRIKSGKEAALPSDRNLMAVRARAMPPKAESASVRVAGRLDFDARVALASQLELDVVPADVSVWGDVIDDLAVVALLSGDDAREARALARAIEAWRRQLMAHPWVRDRALQLTLASVNIITRGTDARVVLVIGPRRLDRMVERIVRSLSRPSSEAQP